MKYIRTKNGIYEVKTKRIFNHIKEYRLGDTIEELCDKFVYEYKSSVYKNSKPSYELVEMSLETMKATMEFFSGATFYGAIWTNKGLIYVAKMNSEGKLVLI